jgi:hypothetical protein
MRCGHAKHGRTARTRTSADPQRARGLCPRALPAKRRTEESCAYPQGQPKIYRVATCARRRLETPARTDSPSFYRELLQRMVTCQRLKDDLLRERGSFRKAIEPIRREVDRRTFPEQFVRNRTSDCR